MAKSEKQSGKNGEAKTQTTTKGEEGAKNTDPQPPKKEEGDVASEIASSTSASSVTGSGSAASSSSKSGGGDKAGDKAQQQEASAPQQPRGRDLTLEGLTIELSSGKRLLVDVKENFRGKFIRLAERGGGRGRVFGMASDRVNVPLRIAKGMAERLDEFIDKARQQGEKRQPLGASSSSASQQQRAAPLHSVALHEEGRRYFIDLLPSRAKGRELQLRIAASNQGVRSAVVIEAEGIAALKEVLDTLLAKYKHDVDEEEKFTHGELQFGRKRFYFDPIAQQRGRSVKITEVVRGNDQLTRSVIVIPDRLLAEFAEMLHTYDGQLNANREHGDGEKTKKAEEGGSGEKVDEKR